MKPTRQNVLNFLRESNYIEDEFSRGALIQANRAWKYLMSHELLTPEIIKQAHAILMKHTDIADKWKGDWRNVPVSIGGMIKTQPKPVIDSLVRDFCAKVNLQPKDVLKLHVEFENIHPFIDGNGRIGRMIMNWHNVKRNGTLLIFTMEGKFTYYYPIFSKKQKDLDKALGFAQQKHDYYNINRF